MLKDFKKSKLLGRRIFSVFALVLSVLAIFVLAQVLAGLIVSLIAIARNGGVDGSIDWATESNIAKFLAMGIGELAVILFVWRILKWQKVSWKTIGLHRPKLNDLLYGVIGYVAFFGLIIILIPLFSYFFPSIDVNQQQDIGFSGLASGYDRLLGFIGLVLIPPIAEEILMRGYFYSGLRKLMKFLPALIITSLIFGLGHLFGGQDGSVIWIATINTFVLSIGLTYLREKTGSVWAGIYMHGINNLIAYLVLLHG